MARYYFTICYWCLLFLAMSSCSTSAGLSLEEELEQLRENYMTSQKMLESQITRLESEMTEMKVKIAKTEELELQIKQQRESLLVVLQRDENSRSSQQQNVERGSQHFKLPHRLTEVNITHQQSKSTNGPSGNQYPSSCDDLYKMGHTLSGVYSVIGSRSVETVYCDFYKTQNQLGFQTFQKWIGYADVKSLPTYFYVQRSSNFDTVGVPIPFQIAKVNIGGSMDLASGKFTAQTKGLYFFSFMGEAWIPPNTQWAQLGVALMLNGNQVGLGHVEGHANWKWQHTPLVIQATLDMKKGDQVWLQIKLISPSVVLVDSFNQHNHYTGMLLHEDIFPNL